MTERQYCALYIIINSGSSINITTWSYKFQTRKKKIINILLKTKNNTFSSKMFALINQSERKVPKIRLVARRTQSIVWYEFPTNKNKA